MQKIVNYYINLIKNNLYWLKQAGFLFLIAFGLGIFGYLSSPGYVDDILQAFQNKFGVEPIYDFDLAVKIFLNNINASMVALLGGIAVGILPVLVLLSNGLVIGYLLTYFTAVPEGSSASSALLALLSLIPHGIFEIPAVLLAAGMGLKIGFNFMKKEHKGRRREIFWQNIKEGVSTIPVVILLLAIAALIEVFVSARLLV